MLKKPTKTWDDGSMTPKEKLQSLELFAIEFQGFIDRRRKQFEAECKALVERERKEDKTTGS